MNNTLKAITVFLLVVLSYFVAAVAPQKNLVLCTLYVLIYALFSGKEKTRAKCLKGERTVVLLSFLAVIFIVSFILSQFFTPDVRSFTLFEALMSVFLFPIAEELSFRGTLYKSLKSSIPKWAAVVISALVFALFHGTVPAMIAAFSAGVMLCLIYDRYGIVLPILCHVSNNLLALISHLRG